MEATAGGLVVAISVSAPFTGTEAARVIAVADTAAAAVGLGLKSGSISASMASIWASCSRSFWKKNNNG